MRDAAHHTSLDRRRFHQLSLLTAAGFLAGCLGDDEPDDDDPGDDTDDEAPIDDADDEDPSAGPDDDDDPGDDVDDTDDTEPEIDLVDINDVTLYAEPRGDPPADTQFHPYGDGPGPWFPPQARLVVHSQADYGIHGMLVKDWDYMPGVLEFELHDDFYWWTGDNVTAEDYVAKLAFDDFYFGGDELDAHDNIVTYDQTGDHSVRLSLPDTWNEPWALFETIENEDIESSRMFHGPLNEQFEDAPDLDAIEEFRIDIEESRHTTDEELVLHSYLPFEVRLDDDGYGSVGGDFWELEFVPEKNGNVRHFANLANSDRLPNYRYIRIETREEPQVAATEHFLEGRCPWASSNFLEGAAEGLDEEAPFSVETIVHDQPPQDPAGWNFNHEQHPADNVHFRRAWAYLNNLAVWERHFQSGVVEYFHPFLSDGELETFVSEDVIDSLTDYGWNEHRWDDAETELVTGGFERDADGNWLMQRDNFDLEAGEPFDFEIATYDFTTYIVDLATDFFADLEEFGIQSEWIADTGSAWGVNEDYVISPQYTGGGLPEIAFGMVYIEPGASRNAYNVPSVITAPPLGETSSPGDSTDDWQEYEVAAMTDRLSVTTDTDTYQQLVDELTWACNHSVNHFTIGPRITTVFVNDDQWSAASFEEYPEKWWEFDFRLITNGTFQYRDNN